MDFEDRYRKWSSCDPAELFSEARVVTYVPEDKQDIKKNLEQSVRGCSDLILWLDCDREGEAIGFEVIDVCRAANPRLRIRRARFSALIPRDIHQAMQNLVQPDQSQADAVRARSEIDLRLGAAFTRLQTKTLQGQLEAHVGSRLISGAAAQHPALLGRARQLLGCSAHSREESPGRSDLHPISTMGGGGCGATLGAGQDSRQSSAVRTSSTPALSLRPGCG